MVHLTVGLFRKSYSLAVWKKEITVLGSRSELVPFGIKIHHKRLVKFRFEAFLVFLFSTAFYCSDNDRDARLILYRHRPSHDS